MRSGPPGTSLDSLVDCCLPTRRTMADDEDVPAFLKFRGQLDDINWSAPLPKGRRTEMLSGGPQVRAPCLTEESHAFQWEDIDEGPAESDDSWAAFAPKDQINLDGKLLAGGKKLSKEQRQKQKDAEQLAEARDSIRRRGWTEGEVKWRSWLARRGHDTMVQDWNLYQYIDGECIPPSRDPFWINSNEVRLLRAATFEAGVPTMGPCGRQRAERAPRVFRCAPTPVITSPTPPRPPFAASLAPALVTASQVPLPDYEAGNDVPNEVGPMEVTNILGERIEPKWKPPRVTELEPLWHDVDGATLVEQGLGRVTEGYYWRQTMGARAPPPSSRIEPATPYLPHCPPPHSDRCPPL